MRCHRCLDSKIPRIGIPSAGVGLTEWLSVYFAGSPREIYVYCYKCCSNFTARRSELRLLNPARERNSGNLTPLIP